MHKLGLIFGIHRQPRRRVLFWEELVIRSGASGDRQHTRHLGGRRQQRPQTDGPPAVLQ